MDDNLLMLRKAIVNYMDTTNERMVEYFRAEGMLFALAAIAEALVVLAHKANADAGENEARD